MATELLDQLILVAVVAVVPQQEVVTNQVAQVEQEY
jgi:hypothetical protein